MRRSRPALLLLLPALAFAACGDDKEPTAEASKPAASTPVETAPEPSGSGSDLDFSDVKAGECKEVSWPSPKDPGVDKPEGKLDPASKPTVTLETSCGKVVIELAAKEHPKTANVFASLAKAGYLDGTGFHRVVPGLIIQGGDPSGDGTGGPNWEVVEPPAKDETYKRGTVAMAKTAAAPSGASGSQFFIVTAPEGGYPPDYAIAGRVTSGLDVVEAIGALGAEGQDGPPSRAAVIGKATFKEG